MFRKPVHVFSITVWVDLWLYWIPNKFNLTSVVRVVYAIVIKTIFWRDNYFNQYLLVIYLHSLWHLLRWRVMNVLELKISKRIHLILSHVRCSKTSKTWIHICYSLIDEHQELNSFKTYINNKCFFFNLSASFRLSLLKIAWYYLCHYKSRGIWSSWHQAEKIPVLIKFRNILTLSPKDTGK